MAKKFIVQVFNSREKYPTAHQSDAVYILEAADYAFAGMAALHRSAEHSNGVADVYANHATNPKYLGKVTL